jgi:hypothetical protein
MMQKLKGKSNSVDIHTGHPVFCQEFTVLMIFTKWVANVEASLSGTKPHRRRHD